MFGLEKKTYKSNHSGKKVKIVPSDKKYFSESEYLHRSFFLQKSCMLVFPVYFLAFMLVFKMFSILIIKTFLSKSFSFFSFPFYDDVLSFLI